MCGPTYIFEVIRLARIRSCAIHVP